jgi:O-antigen/teichoic acid export membrane protein
MLARATVLNLAARLMSGAAAFGLAILTANVLSTHGRGVYAILSTAAGIGLVVIGATETVLVADLIHGRDEEPVLQGVAFLIAAASAFVLLVLAATTSIVVGGSLFVALLCTAAITALSSYSSIVMYISQARGDVQRVSLALIGMDLFPFITSAAAVVIFKPTVTALMVAWAVAALVTASLQMADGRATTGVLIRRAERRAASIARRSLGVSLSNAIVMLLSRIDVLVVAAVVSVSEAGVYSIPVALSTGLMLLSRSLLTATYHSIMTLPVSEVGTRLAWSVRNSLLVVLVGGALSVPVIAVTARYVFGRAYSGIWLPYAILVPGSACFAVDEVLRHFLLTRLERQREYIVITTAMLVINGMLAVGGAATLGLPGAAASTTIAYALGALALVWVCARSVSLSMRELAVPRYSDLASCGRLGRRLVTRLRSPRAVPRP